MDRLDFKDDDYIAFTDFMEKEEKEEKIRNE